MTDVNNEVIDPAGARGGEESGSAASERPSKYAKMAVLASSVGYALDGFDFLILSFALSAISTQLHLTHTQAGSLATLTLFGAVFGGLVFGVLADHVGRVKVLTYSVIFFAVFTGLTALSHNWASAASSASG
jgi:MFS family permease